jgi:hypothetical protein
MFSMGQRVWHRDGKHSCKVLKCDGGQVYIEQDNGVELAGGRPLLAYTAVMLR